MPYSTVGREAEPPVRLYGDPMRSDSDWVTLSASALVVGAMALVLGALLNPQSAGDDPNQALVVVTEQGGRWLGMAVAYFSSSVALIVGLPSLLSLFADRGRRTGYAGVVVFAVGVLGLAGFAMLLVFFRALAGADAIQDARLQAATEDLGLSLFLNGWIACFYGGIALLAVALHLSRQTPRWIPVLLGAFVLLFPFSTQIGRIGQLLQVLALAFAFTGVAIAAVNRVNRAVASRHPAY